MAGRTSDPFGSPEGVRRTAASTGPATAGRTDRGEMNCWPVSCLARRNANIGLECLFHDT
jgi:hypothetical protein